MHTGYFAAYLGFVSGALGSPLAGNSEGIQARDDRGSETISGLGQRKQAILHAGGNTLDLAIAMLETKNMGTDYVYGDAKSNDAANFGIFKQNWGMLRVCGSRAGFVGKFEAEWNDGAKLNSDLYADVASRWDCQEHYGYDLWFAGHRFGSSGLADPYTKDIQAYKDGVKWIQSQIDSDSKYQSDDTRFWVDVIPI